MKKIENFMLPEHTNQLYKNEAISSIALTKEVAEKINEIINSLNEFASDDLIWKQEQDGRVRKAVIYMKDNLLNSLNDLMEQLRDSGFIDDRIEYHCDNLKARLDTAISGMTVDSELIDLRVGADGKTYANAGESVRTQFKNSLMGLGRIDQSILTDINDIEVNSVYHIADWTGINNLPIEKVGTCITISSDDIGRGLQLYATNTGELYYRIFWTPINSTKVWREWKNTDFSTDINKCLYGYGYVVEGDTNDFESNSVYSVTDWTNVSNLPTKNVGSCLTFSMDNEGTRGGQIYLTKDNEFYTRAFWTNSKGVKSWTEWTSSVAKPDFNVYPIQYATVGRELNFYYCQMFNCVNWKSEGIAPSFSYNGTGAKGYDDRISIIPTKAGTYTLTINSNVIIDGLKVVDKSIDITINVSTNEIPTTTKNVLFIGDSRTDFARITKYAKSELGNSINLLGTLTEDDCNHEGRSGWTAEGYCTMSNRNDITNPFYNSGKFDFSYYMNNNGYSKVDYVNLMFGVNSLYSNTSPDYIEQIIESIHNYDSSIKISVMTEYGLPFSAYYSGDYRRSLLSKVFYKKLVDKFGNRENENIFILSTNLVIDDNYDWNKTSISVCQLNTTDTIEVISDNIHCKECGYNKISNVWLMFYQNKEQ